MFHPRVLGMFLLGFYAGRAGIFANLDAHAALLRRVCVMGFAAGLPLSLVATELSTGGVGPPDLRGLVETILQSISSPALALAYAAGLCLLFRRAPRPMLALAPAGRMALTNYIGAERRRRADFLRDRFPHVRPRVADDRAGRIRGVFRAADDREPAAGSRSRCSARRNGSGGRSPTPGAFALFRGADAPGYCTLASRISNTSAAFGGIGPSELPVVP